MAPTATSCVSIVFCNAQYAKEAVLTAASQRDTGREIVKDSRTQFMKTSVLHAYVSVVVRAPFGGMRGECSGLKMGLFLHAVGSVTPTESAAADTVRLLTQKQGFLR